MCVEMEVDLENAGIKRVTYRHAAPIIVSSNNCFQFLIISTDFYFIEIENKNPEEILYETKLYSPSQIYDEKPLPSIEKDILQSNIP